MGIELACIVVQHGILGVEIDVTTRQQLGSIITDIAKRVSLGIRRRLGLPLGLCTTAKQMLRLEFFHHPLDITTLIQCIQVGGDRMKETIAATPTLFLIQLLGLFVGDAQLEKEVFPRWQRDQWSRSLGTEITCPTWAQGGPFLGFPWS